MRRELPKPPTTLAEIVARIPIRGRRKPTNARVCACGDTWFAYTSVFWWAIVDVENGWLLLGASKYTGVFPDPDMNGKWEAQIRADGRVLGLGRFAFESDAAIAYNVHAAHYFGEFAKLNKITEYFHD